MATYIVQPFHAIWTACSSRYRNLPLYMTLTVYVREALIFSMLFTYIYVSNDHDINRDPRFQLIEICLFSFCCSFFFSIFVVPNLAGLIVSDLVPKNRKSPATAAPRGQGEAGATSRCPPFGSYHEPSRTNGATVAPHPARGAN